MHASRYVVGIDLGTTNSVVSYVDTEAPEAEQAVRPLPLAQVVAAGDVEPRPALPSFLYLAAGHELPAGALDLPWAEGRDFAVGAFARDQGAKVPARLVSSAKSWLCHAGVDRTAPLLPWDAPDEVPRLSPLEATTRYLEHIRDAWNATMAADDPFASLEDQAVLLTVPASFDDAARQLTSHAAARAGLAHVTLLEEPQAAFYAWLHHQGEAWREQLGVGDLVLVCDVGGGTTDFTLIAVGDDGGELVLERVAVGDHILLGGDNMDLALAHVVAEALGERGHRLDPWQSRALWHAARAAKEALLSDPSLDAAPVTVLGRGSRVIGGAVRGELARADLERVLVEGFLPACEPGEGPRAARRAGLAEMGLPYASDAAITRHLSAFLARHAPEGAPLARPTALLFNGGVMKADLLRGRIAGVLADWAGASGGDAPRPLPSADLDLAVSQGAAYYGLVRRGRGVRIRGGVPRTYYLGVESALPAVPGMPAPLKALCVVPFGFEEGGEAELPGQSLAMVVGEPASFRFLSSTARKEDALGAVVSRWPEGEIEELAPIEAAMEPQGLEPGAVVPVKLHARVTEVGVLDLELHGPDGRRWKLEYSVRDQR